MAQIIIEVEGGLVQSVRAEGIVGIDVVVRDYDTDGREKHVETDENGRPFSEEVHTL